MRKQIDALSRHKERLFKISPGDVFSSVGPFTILLLLSLAAAYYFIDPAPPHHVVISVGREESEYQDYASSYKEILARDDIQLDSQISEGTLDNLKSLKSSSSKVDIAFLIDGLHDGEDADIYSLGSISYEPIWLFYRDSKVHNRLAEFAGKRIAVGKQGSGVQALAKRLLVASGIHQDDARLVASGREEAVDMLEHGAVDAVFLLGQPDAPSIRKLLNQPGIRILDFDQAQAYTRQFPFLHELVLPHGTLDIHDNIPATDLHLLATTTIVAVRDSLHPAIISLLMKAMTEVHDVPGLLHKEHTFPEDHDVDFDLSPVAQHYYKSGPSFLQHYLPFWLSTLIDRTLLVALPLFALMVPLSKTIPPLYRWRVKRRINRWYGELIQLETRLKTGKDYTDYLSKLEWIEEQVAHMTVPLSFSDYSYVLKEHIDLVRRKILRLQQEAQPKGEPQAST